MPLVTVRGASELTGKDRSTITRAISKGRLSATKDDHGRFLIDPAELERAFGSLASPDARIDASHQQARAHDAPALIREVELLRDQLVHERGERDHERRSWEDERQFLRALVERHAEQIKLLTDQREPEAPPSPGRRVGWWRRLLGRA